MLKILKLNKKDENKGYLVTGDVGYKDLKISFYYWRKKITRFW